MGDNMNENILNMIAITLQNTITKLGPMPNELGEEVNQVLESGDTIRVIALGCKLDDCIKNGKYPE